MGSMSDDEFNDINRFLDIHTDLECLPPKVGFNQWLKMNLEKDRNDQKRKEDMDLHKVRLKKLYKDKIAAKKKPVDKSGIVIRGTSNLTRNFGNNYNDHYQRRRSE